VIGRKRSASPRFAAPSRISRASGTSSFRHEAVADLDALCEQERVGHRAADQECVDAPEQAAKKTDLVGDLRAAEHDHERTRRLARRGERFSSSRRISGPMARAETNGTMPNVEA